MNVKETIARLEREIEDRKKSIAFLTLKENALESLPPAEFYDFNKSLDFNFLSHDQVIQVVKAIGGKWKKEPKDDKVNYTTEKDGITIRIYQGEPPPNCRIVQEEYEVPAQPAFKAMRSKLVCKETVTPESVEVQP